MSANKQRIDDLTLENDDLHEFVITLEAEKEETAQEANKSAAQLKLKAQQLEATETSLKAAMGMSFVVVSVCLSVCFCSVCLFGGLALSFASHFVCCRLLFSCLLVSQHRILRFCFHFASIVAARAHEFEAQITSLQAEKSTVSGRYEAELKKLRQELKDQDLFANELRDKIAKLEAESATHEEALLGLRNANADLEVTLATLQKSNAALRAKGADEGAAGEVGKQHEASVERLTRQLKQAAEEKSREVAQLNSKYQALTKRLEDDLKKVQAQRVRSCVLFSVLLFLFRVLVCLFIFLSLGLAPSISHIHN